MHNIYWNRPLYLGIHTLIIRIKLVKTEKALTTTCFSQYGSISLPPDYCQTDRKTPENFIDAATAMVTVLMNIVNKLYLTSYRL